MDEKIFFKPPKCFLGKPFWAWNCGVERSVLKEQIGYFDEMGMGGFVIHSRTGMSLPYLGEQFMNRVGESVGEAKKRDLSVWLYDEDRWPSGFAGGHVTKNPEYRARYLVFTALEGGKEPENTRHKKDGRLDLRPHGGGKLLENYAVTVRGGRLESYRTGTAKWAGEETWYLYEEEMGEDPWFNNQTYMDTLNSEAVAQFVTITYEAYEATLGEEFGNSVEAIFTDEPQFVHKRFLEYEGSKEAVILPYTIGLNEAFENQFGFGLLERLPELVWDTGDGRSLEIRYLFHRFLSERFSRTYSDYLGKWCETHGILLTGHMKGEDTLYSQTASVGEAMRNYQYMQIPGIDILCDKRLYSTAKQAQSVSRQFGRNRVTSEEYGVTNWDFDFVGHKLQGDWQAALGVTDRVHHLAWMSMEGEAKRDFPASIFYQSPWYREYATLEQYFGRIRMAMEEGSSVTRVAVIHPIESFWMVYGGADYVEEKRRQEKLFAELTEWLLFGLIDFDYLSEALIPALSNGDAMQFGEMCYSVILVPEILTLRNSTLERLKQFQKGGGTVLFLGKLPAYVEGKESQEPKKFAGICNHIEVNREMLLDCLGDVRDVDITDESGERSTQFLYQMRKNGKVRWLFVANGRKPEDKDNPQMGEWRVAVKGRYLCEQWNCLDGTVILLKAQYEKRETQIWTVVKTHMSDQDSLLLRLLEEGHGIIQAEEQKNQGNIFGEAPLSLVEFLQVDSYALEEANVLMLDQAEFHLNQDAWEKKEEILRIENRIRTCLCYPQKTEAYAQPWTTAVSYIGEEELSFVTLKFEIMAEVVVKNISLAIEHPNEKQIFWNGKRVPIRDTGYYVDRAIRTIRLPDVEEGRQELVVKQRFHPDSSLEWLYLLGNFGVRIEEDSVCLIPIKTTIDYGNLVKYGFPFYGGTVFYYSQIEVEEGEYVLEISKFRAPILSVTVDGKRVGIIAFAPYQVSLGMLAGKHEICIAAYGNRVNTFGAVHNCDKQSTWYGPGAWRTSGEKYNDAYQFKETGILEAPKLYRRQRPSDDTFLDLERLSKDMSAW